MLSANDADLTISALNLFQAKQFFCVISLLFRPYEIKNEEFSLRCK